MALYRSRAAYRSAFFQSIAERLRPEGILLSSDLAGDLATAECQDLLEVWFRVMSGSGATPSPEGLTRMREAYSRNVTILPPQEARAMLTRGGFVSPVLFFKAGMIMPGMQSDQRARPLRGEHMTNEPGAVELSVQDLRVVARVAHLMSALDTALRSDRPHRTHTVPWTAQALAASAMEPLAAAGRRARKRSRICSRAASSSEAR